MNIKRVLCSVLASSFGLLLSWLGGYDFDIRGDAAITTAMFVLFLGTICYTCPGWEDK